MKALRRRNFPVAGERGKSRAEMRAGMDAETREMRGDARRWDRQVPEATELSVTIEPPTTTESMTRSCSKNTEKPL